MTEIDLIIDLHKNTQRQGPGSEKDTLNALNLIGLSLDPEVKLADIGCGSGGQTLTLAQNLNGHITAVDLFPEFLDELNEKSKKLGLEGKIKTLKASMDNLPFMPGEFDVIWSEGAIYNMGFEKGIRNWKKFLKEGGYLALSEITWTTISRPQEIDDFWTSQYPEIDTAANKIKILESNGYSLVGYFILSEDSWIENYYKPLESQFGHFLKRNENSDLAKKVVRDYRSEIELYMKYKEYYSYGFFIAKKTE
jgi:cyclopropane fatty-acyl-phospholipid synthase-like methyltransferase